MFKGLVEAALTFRETHLVQHRILNELYLLAYNDFHLFPPTWLWTNRKQTGYLTCALDNDQSLSITRTKSHAENRII